MWGEIQPILAAGCSLRQPPNSGDHVGTPLVVFRCFGRRARLDLDTVALPNALELRVHQTRYAVFARQNSKVRAHRSPGTNDAVELLENGCGQGPPAIVDDRYQLARYPLVHQVQY